MHWSACLSILEMEHGHPRDKRLAPLSSSNLQRMSTLQDKTFMSCLTTPTLVSHYWLALQERLRERAQNLLNCAAWCWSSQPHLALAAFLVKHNRDLRIKCMCDQKETEVASRTCKTTTIVHQSACVMMQIKTRATTLTLCPPIAQVHWCLQQLYLVPEL